jgi:putative methyltransferase (TIGR04325 family)
VVEQPAFVQHGQAGLADGRLDFFESVPAALAAGAPDVLLLGSVLPYVPEPHALLRTLLAVPPARVLVERTAVVGGPRDRLTVQHVPASLGGGSYPCWHLARAGLLAHFADYELLREEAAADGAADGVDFRNLWFGRRNTP